jgi:aspartate aminotransferase-like enzyme
MENVWKRHKAMGDFCRGWAKKSGFKLFCDEKYASNTLTTVENIRNINVGDVIKAVKAKHNTIFSAGYGQLKDKTFRIAHMGDITIDEVRELLGWIDAEIG